MIKTTLAWIAGIALALAGIFGLNYFGLMQFEFFAPRYEAVRRDTMIQSRAYTEASIRELYRLREQYVGAKTDDQRAALRGMVLHEFSTFDRDRLPAELAQFYYQVQLDSKSR